jgi:hypothetical protein
MNSQLFDLKGFEIFYREKIKKNKFLFLKTDQNNKIMRLLDYSMLQLFKKNF